MKRILLFGVLFAAVLLGAACAEDANSEEMRICEEKAQATPALLLVGTEGTSEICRCTVDSVATRFPNAAELWVSYEEELQSRMNRRGIVGFLVDSTWQNSKGKDMARFVLVQGQMLASCSQRLLKEWSGVPPD